MALPALQFIPAAFSLQCAGSGLEVMSSYATGSLITSGGGFSDVAPQPSYQVRCISLPMGISVHYALGGEIYNVFLVVCVCALPFDGLCCSCDVLV